MVALVLLVGESLVLVVGLNVSVLIDDCDACGEVLCGGSVEVIISEVDSVVVTVTEGPVVDVCCVWVGVAGVVGFEVKCFVDDFVLVVIGSVTVGLSVVDFGSGVVCMVVPEVVIAVTDDVDVDSGVFGSDLVVDVVSKLIVDVLGVVGALV